MSSTSGRGVSRGMIAATPASSSSSAKLDVAFDARAAADSVVQKFDQSRIDTPRSISTDATRTRCRGRATSCSMIAGGATRNVKGPSMSSFMNARWHASIASVHIGLVAGYV